MTFSSFGITAAFLLYLAGMMAIGLFHSRRQKSMADYILGSRTMGILVTSMSEEAADMGGWLMMGLPGFAYVAGAKAGWIALGLVIGTYINWKVFAAKQRTCNQVANDSLPLSGYLQHCFHDYSKTLRIVSALNSTGF